MIAEAEIRALLFGSSTLRNHQFVESVRLANTNVVRWALKKSITLNGLDLLIC